MGQSVHRQHVNNEYSSIWAHQSDSLVKSQILVEITNLWVDNPDDEGFGNLPQGSLPLGSHVQAALIYVFWWVAHGPKPRILVKRFPLLATTYYENKDLYQRHYRELRGLCADELRALGILVDPAIYSPPPPPRSSLAAAARNGTPNSTPARTFFPSFGGSSTSRLEKDIEQMRVRQNNMMDGQHIFQLRQETFNDELYDRDTEISRRVDSVNSRVDNQSTEIARYSASIETLWKNDQARQAKEDARRAETASWRARSAEEMKKVQAEVAMTNKRVEAMEASQRYYQAAETAARQDLEARTNQRIAAVEARVETILLSRVGALQIDKDMDEDMGEDDVGANGQN